MRNPGYTRTQTPWAPWLIAAALVLGNLGRLAWFGATPHHGSIALQSGLGLLPLLALSVFGRFTVEVGEGRVEWRFGYLGVPRWQRLLSEIVAVEAARVRWFEGWGIRRTRSGWLYNIQGFGAVRLRCRDGSVLRIGSDEPERLAAFIAARLAPY